MPDDKLKTPSNKYSQRGFTLTEMLIAIAIIGSLSTLVVVNISQLKSGSAVTYSSEEFSALLRQSQLWSLTGQTYSGTRPAGGWGIHIETCTAGSCTYFLFADTYPSTPNYTYDDGNDIKVQSVSLDATVGVSSISPINGNSIDIVFDTPSGSVYLNGTQVDDEAVIVFTHAQSGDQKTVRVNQVTGRIDIIN